MRWKGDAIQLELLPMSKQIRNKTYLLVITEIEYEKARQDALRLRKSGFAVQIEKDGKDGIIEPNAYLIWGRYKYGEMEA